MTESSTILISIKDSTKLSDQTLAFHFTEGVLTNLPDTTLQATEYYSCQNGTIYQGYTASNYVIPLLASPIKSGHVWTYPNGTNGTVTATIISVTSGYYNNQSIDTIVAVRHYHQDNTTGTMDDTIWFARTIGILKKSTMSQVSTDTSYSLQQLISYTFPR
ncbi:MAG TPA: hypothetical protein VMU30_12930 [Bacteroidota bacterium]|nr:hypothetical protein [Bacteroidota bacterium]